MGNGKRISAQETTLESHQGISNTAARANPMLKEVTIYLQVLMQLAQNGQAGGICIQG